MDDSVEGELWVEQYSGTIQCNRCGFWGIMPGFIQPGDNKFIDFICSECKAVERVVNPEA